MNVADHERGQVMNTADVDVLIVGYGPVGQLLSIQLAQQGVRVAAVDRWLEPYGMPRAVSYDDEAARILAAAGVSDVIADCTEPTRDYLWRNAAGRTLLTIDVPDRFRSGWPQSTSFYQPGLEARLIEHAAGYDEVTVARGHEAVELDQDSNGVRLVTRAGDGQRHEFTGRWAIGCDGASSFVRGRMDVTTTDLDFAREWLICDVVFTEPRVFTPNNLQVCDPSRPRTSVSAGPGHRRCEFMRVPRESAEEFCSEANMWRMLALFDVRPDNATLGRHAVYTTGARHADLWRRGRFLLAGDAAHVMPPFMGQGMCAGFRDAANLSWKLAMVLAGTADPSVLDTFTPERSAHVRRAIDVSVEAGNVICETSRPAAAGRDAYMFAAQRGGAATPPGASLAAELGTGLMHVDAAGKPVGAAGRLTPQGRIARGGRTGLFDQVVGTGFVLLTLDDPDDDSARYLSTIGAHVVRLRDIEDLDGTYTAFLADLDARAALIRPDYYLFGAATGASGVRPLVDALRGWLRPESPPGEADPLTDRPKAMVASR